MRKTLVLYAPLWGGHHPTYTKLITEILLKKGYKVWLLCPHPEKITSPQLETLKIREFIPRGGLKAFVDVLSNWASAAQSIKILQKRTGQKPDLVFFTILDHHIKGLLPSPIVDWIFPYNWAGLIVHLSLNSSWKARKFKYLSALTSKNCRGLATLQEDMVEPLKKIAGRKNIIFPDITDETLSPTTSLSQKIQQAAADRKIISLLGDQNKRKGTIVFLEAIAQSTQKDRLFVLAGSISSEEDERNILTLIEKYGLRDSNNCYFHFESLPDGAEFNALVKISDVLFALYHNSGPFSSNLLTKAAAFHKPVLVNKGTLLEKRVQKYSTGAAAREDDISGILLSLETLLNKGPLKPLYDEYAQLHSHAALESAITELLE